MIIIKGGFWMKIGVRILSAKYELNLKIKS